PTNSSEDYSAACVAESGGLRRVQRLIEVVDEVINVFDADAEPDRFGSYSSLALFFGRHLSMRAGGRVARQGFGVAQIHEPHNQLKRVVELHGGRKAPLDSEGHQGTGSTQKISLGERTIET